MKRYSFLLLALVVLTGAAQADISITTEYAIDGTTLTSPYANAIVDTFDADRPGWTYTGNGALAGPGDVYSGSTQVAAAPYNEYLSVDDDTKYFRVPENVNVAPQSAMVQFGDVYNYLGLFWGSMDDYNKIEFLLLSDNGETIVATFTGLNVSDLADGGQTDDLDNGYVNFHNVPDFNAVRFTSTQYAFEFDNLAVAVPVPGAVLLGLLGLGVAGRKLRKRA